MKADRVFKNAKIYSIALDGTETRAEALAIKDGKFVYVGDETGLSDWIGETTEVVDCNGKSIIPGLGDAHLHNAQATMKYGVCPLGNIVPNPEKDTPDDVVKQIQEMLKQYAEEHKDSPIIKGVGWDRMWFSGNLQGETRSFNKHDIDKVISDKPVVLTSFCGHVVVLNSKALEAAGVTKDTDDQKGLIEKDEWTGEPTGYISEPAAFGPIVHKIPNYDFSYQEYHDSLESSFKEFAEKGYTLVCDCQQMTSSYEVLNDMAKNGEFTARVKGVHNINDASRNEDLKKAIENRTKFNVDDLFVVDTVKYFADGNPSMQEPYSELARWFLWVDQDYTDPLLWDEERMKDSMVQATREGFNIDAHSFGSYTTNKLIDFYEYAQNLYPNPELRNAISHCTWVSSEDKERMAKDHIIASIQPGWQSANPEMDPVNVAVYGKKVATDVYPNKSFMDQGVMCAYGSDYPVNPVYGLAGIQVAMTRRFVKQDARYEALKHLSAAKPEERCSLKEALQAHTINVAYKSHLEDVTGSIEVGKSAELVVLDRDIENTPVLQIQDIEVLETVFKGKTVYKVD